MSSSRSSTLLATLSAFRKPFLAFLSSLGVTQLEARLHARFVLILLLRSRLQHSDGAEGLQRDGVERVLLSTSRSSACWTWNRILCEDAQVARTLRAAHIQSGESRSQQHD